MKKLINILSITAAILCGLSLFCLLICIIFQKSLLSLFIKNAVTAFVLPVDAIVYILGIGGICVLVLFTSAKAKVGIWSEIISISYLALVSPVLNFIISFLQSLLSARYSVTQATALNASMKSLCNLPMGIAGLAASICLVICGMSIVYKNYNR